MTSLKKLGSKDLTPLLSVTLTNYNLSYTLINLQSGHLWVSLHQHVYVQRKQNALVKEQRLQKEIN